MAHQGPVDFLVYPPRVSPKTAVDSYLRSLATVEPSTMYDRGDAEPEEYRLGLDPMSQRTDDNRD